jgi:hypothetical protein
MLAYITAIHNDIYIKLIFPETFEFNVASRLTASSFLLRVWGFRSSVATYFFALTYDAPSLDNLIRTFIDKAVASSSRVWRDVRVRWREDMDAITQWPRVICQASGIPNSIRVSVLEYILWALSELVGYLHKTVYVRAFFLRVKIGFTEISFNNILTTNEDGSRPVNRLRFKPKGLIHIFLLIEVFSKVHGSGTCMLIGACK